MPVIERISRPRWPWAVPIALAFGLTSATAMEPSRPCTRPAVFSGGAVNAVVLPYRHTGAEEGRLGEAGERLSLLVHLEALFSMIKYGGVGAVRLIDGDSVCDPDRVLSQLLGDERREIQALGRHRQQSLHQESALARRHLDVAVVTDSRDEVGLRFAIIRAQGILHQLQSE